MFGFIAKIAGKVVFTIKLIKGLKPRKTVKEVKEFFDVFREAKKDGIDAEEARELLDEFGDILDLVIPGIKSVIDAVMK